MLGFPWWLRQWRICLQCRRPGFNPCVGRIPWRKEWQPTLVFFAREIHRQRSLVGYSPWGHKDSDTTEQLTLSHTFMRGGSFWRVKHYSLFPKSLFTKSDISTGSYTSMGPSRKSGGCSSREQTHSQDALSISRTRRKKTVTYGGKAF